MRRWASRTGVVMCIHVVPAGAAGEALPCARVCECVCVCFLFFVYREVVVPAGDAARVLPPCLWGTVLRGTIVKRTYGMHKNLYISLFLLTRFGPIYYGPPHVLVVYIVPVEY